MNNNLIKDNIIKLPDTCKKLDKLCPVCRTRSMVSVNGKEYCGNCLIIKKKEDLENKIKEHGPERITDYYKDKKEKRGGR